MKLKLLGLVLGGLVALVVVQPALAFHCYVADKPDGAGTATLSDAKPAGQSGNVVLPGAFISASEFGGPDVDVFFRGQPVDEPDAPVGLGTLPEQPHDAGSPDHGVLDLE